MSHLIRHIIHIAAAFTLALAFFHLNFTSKAWVCLLLLSTWLTQYLLLSPILRFKFWTRFIVTLIFWGVSVFGISYCVALIVLTMHLKDMSFEIMFVSSYCFTTISLYELFSSNDTSKESWLGRNLKKIFRKLIDPHDQGIQ